MHAPTFPDDDMCIPPETLLLAYRSGVFPMADSAQDEEVFWVEPRRRAILPLHGFHCSRSLAKALKQGRYRVTMDAAFAQVVTHCAAPRTEPDGSLSGTWISEVIERSYARLHDLGHAHSVECWDGEKLVGGLYGVALDTVFCGESMFSRADNASKVALAWLVATMKRAGYRLLDCQFMTPHLASLGAVEIDRADYQRLLHEAREAAPKLSLPDAFAGWRQPSPSSSGKLIAQSLTQTS